MQAWVFRVGPLGPEQFLYVPVPGDSAQLVLEHVVPASNDRAGLSALRRMVPGAELICAPELADAASDLGLAVGELDQSLRELRADVGLVVVGEERLPAPKPLEARRMFLRGLGIFCNSPAWEHACLTGARLSAELTGSIYGQTCAQTVGLQASPDSLALDVAVGEVVEELGLSLLPAPGFVVSDLAAAYRLSMRPEFTRGAVDAERYSVLGAALLALAAVSSERTVRELDVDNGSALRLGVRAQLHELP